MNESRAIEIRDLSVVSPQGDLIYDNVSLDVEAGDIAIFMGGSGAGKSVLMKIIAGIIRVNEGGWTIRGSIRVFGQDIFQEQSPRVSYIFQDYALFEDLSLEQNLSIARDHSPNTLSEQDRVYLEEQIYDVLLHDIPRDVPVISLSGGQKQRLAIARALFYNPDIIIFDEPNSGLDAKSARSLAGLIQDIGHRFDRTLLLVLHHLHNFLSIADRVYLIDPSTRKMRDVTGHDEKELEDGITSRIDGEKDEEFRPVHPFWAAVDLAGEIVVDFMKSLSRYFIFPKVKRPKWGLFYFWYYQRMVGIFSWTNILYMIIAGIIIGFVATYFIFELLPYREILEPLLNNQLLRGVGYMLYRLAIPLIATILIAAKNGAIVAADIATRTYNRQLLSMQTLSIPYRSYLLTGILWSFVIHTPLLAMFVSFEASRFTSLLVYKWLQPEMSYHLWDYSFHRSLIVDGWFVPLYYGWWWVLSKTAVSGVLVGYIAWFLGSREKKAIRDVNNSVTLTIILSTLAVLLVHFVFTIVEFTHEWYG
jgi:ABC-type multidrug transport system ATPase subunit/ABC-type transporter Mla maintaining outer membrane lipid asymmetry permease subunit MlaE